MDAERDLVGGRRAFAGFALFLACIGLHGITAYAVARRTRLRHVAWHERRRDKDG